MSLVRSCLATIVLGVGLLLQATAASAQQGYEFGIRFQPVNFRPVNFNGFSFQQASFRPINNQPIQFDRITFPALSSRAVRRQTRFPRFRQPQVEPVFTTGNTLPQRRLQLAVNGETRLTQPVPTPSSGGVRTRLALRSPRLPGRSDFRRAITDTSLPTQTALSADPLRAARSVTRTANTRNRNSTDAGARPLLSRVRRDVVARRIADVRSRYRGRRTAGEIRSAQLAGRALQVR